MKTMHLTGSHHGQPVVPSDEVIWPSLFSMLVLYTLVLMTLCLVLLSYFWCDSLFV